MPWLDYALIAILVVSTLISLARGFVREAFSLAIWIVAFWIAWTFFRELAFQFESYVDSPTVRLGVSFALLMIAALLIGGMVNYLLIQLIEKNRHERHRSLHRHDLWGCSWCVGDFRCCVVIRFDNLT